MCHGTIFLFQHMQYVCSYIIEFRHTSLLSYISSLGKRASMNRNEQNVQILSPSPMDFMSTGSFYISFHTRIVDNNDTLYAYIYPKKTNDISNNL
jgi:hypothetical protein